MHINVIYYVFQQKAIAAYKEIIEAELSLDVIDYGDKVWNRIE